MANKNIVLKDNLTSFKYKDFKSNIFKYSLILSSSFNIDTYNIDMQNSSNFSFFKYKNYSKEYTLLLENKIRDIIKINDNKIFKIFDKNYLKRTLKFHGENLENTFFSYQELLSYIIQIDYLINNFNVKFDF